MSGGGGSQTSTTIQQTQIPKWLEGITKDNLAIADAISKRGYEDFPGQMTAGFSPEQEAAFRYMQEGVGMTDPLYQRAAAVTNDVSGYNPTSFLNANIQGYMNPYIQNVESAALDRLQGATRVGLNRIGDQARSAGAFGGSRQGIAEGVALGEASRSAGELSAKLRSDAFNQAAQQFNADQSRGLSAANLRLNAAGQLGTVAQQAQNARLLDASTIEQVGMQRQQLQQQLLDEAYARWNERRNYPIEMLNLRLGATSATPYGQTTTTTQSGGGGSGNALMTGLGAAGTVASIGASLATIF